MSVSYDSRLLEREWGKLDDFIRETAIDIARKINNAHLKIDRSKTLAEQAKQIKGLFKQKQINRNLADAQILANEAMTDLADLVQESIKFTCSSISTANKMHKALTYITVCGLRDVNGRIEKLAEQCVESINNIIEIAEKFVREQKKIKDAEDETRKLKSRGNTGIAGAIKGFFGARKASENKEIPKPVYRPPVSPVHTPPKMPFIYRPHYGKLRLILAIIFTAQTIVRISSVGFDMGVAVTGVIAVLAGFPVCVDIFCLIKIFVSKAAYNLKIRGQMKELKKYEKNLAKYEQKYDRQLAEYNARYGLE